MSGANGKNTFFLEEYALHVFQVYAVFLFYKVIHNDNIVSFVSFI